MDDATVVDDVETAVVVDDPTALDEDVSAESIPAEAPAPEAPVAAIPPADAPVAEPKKKVSKPRKEQSGPRLSHVVVRRFLGAGVQRWPGEVVDATHWHADRLVDARRLRPLTDTDPKPIEAVGRYFIDEDSLIAYAASVVEVADQSEED